jgi:superfamily II DNA helicase RecQ
LDDPSATSRDHDLELNSIDDLKKGKVQILLASPESLLGQYRKLIADLAEANLIGAIAVDEPHCVLKYGYSRNTKGGKKKRAFRPAYSRLLQLRAIIGDVPLVALTATASPETQQKLIKELNMAPCFSLIFPPKKDNIKYIVHKLEKDGDLDTYFGWLRNAIVTQRDMMKKTIVFFHRVAKQTLVYEILDDDLKGLGHIGDPPHNDETHLFEVYHMKTDDSVKESILSHFSKDGHMRCVLASSSFSMGLNIPDIQHVIHFGPAMDLDDFIQETGRASRSLDSKATSVVLLYSKCLNGPNITQEMKDYVKTIGCRRVELLKNYCDDPQPLLPLHDCCDNCSSQCDCGLCPESPLIELGIVSGEGMDTSCDSTDSENQSCDSNASDSDSDMELYRWKPVLVLPNSDSD